LGVNTGVVAATELTHLDLFSGVGGFALAAKWAGFTTVGFVEKNPWCRRILAERFSGVPIYDDIKTFDGTTFDGVDLLTAGVPCQSVSRNGKQLREKDPRFLWPDAFRVVRQVRPRYLLLENPTGLFDGGVFGYVLGELASLGFDAEWDVLPASAFGAFHDRERVFVLAYAAGGDGFSHDLLEAGGEWRASVQSRRFHGMALAEAARQCPNSRLGCEPGLARLVRRIPGAMDRIAAIGNSVYPAAAYLPISAIAQQLRTQTGAQEETSVG
jgi:DNA (cytosine-5)-methyltransferase 1